LVCEELVREHCGPGAALVSCGRPVYCKRDRWCGAHYKRWREGTKMDRPFNPKRGIFRRSSEEVRFRDRQGKKLCCTCKQFLLEDEFAPLDKSADGLQHQCQLCINLYRYGLNRNGIEALMMSQDGCCANPNCRVILQIRSGGRDQPRRNKNVSVACVDHDHNCCPGASSCGKCVRGLLCWHCNAAAGLLGDAPDKISGLAEYLTNMSTAASNG